MASEYQQLLLRRGALPLPRRRSENFIASLWGCYSIAFARGVSASHLNTPPYLSPYSIYDLATRRNLVHLRVLACSALRRTPRGGEIIRGCRAKLLGWQDAFPQREDRERSIRVCFKLVEEFTALQFTVVQLPIRRSETQRIFCLLKGKELFGSFHQYVFINSASSN